MLNFGRKRIAVFSILLLIFICSNLVFGGDDWREITSGELAMKSPKVEPNADAEVIFWEVRVDDSDHTELVMKHYIRVKIFTENGREKYSKVDIPYNNKRMRVKDIEARVIKPDGTIVLLKKEDVFEREIAKANNVKVKAKSFAVPNIETGVILEYRYKEIFRSSSASNMRMLFQHDVPIQNISYFFKPFASTKYYTFNMEDSKFIKDKGGFYRATMTDVPALKDEPRMPPEDEVRSWLLLYYADEKETSTDFWKRVGGILARGFDIKDTLKPGKDLKAAAGQIVGGATAPEDQLAKIHEFCVSKIKNITFDPKITDEQRDEIKPNKSASDTYKKMQGTDDDINELFAAFASALGFETRLAFGGDKSEKFFNPRQAHLSFVHFGAIAVMVNGEWKFYDPGDPFNTFGMLPWFEEETSVLLLGHKDYKTFITPISPPERSAAIRTGKFKLLEDGSLEGTVTAEYTGHLSYLYKVRNYEDSLNQQEETLKDAIRKRMSTAEVTGISIENVNEPGKNFTYQYKIKIPNYAQKTGKRLFLQPGFFEYGANPLFSAADRKYDVFFPHAWSENDQLSIELPKGYSLDSADSPGEMTDDQKISAQLINIGIDKTNNILTYQRKFFFGGGGYTLFPVRSYKALKQLFDEFHKNNSHTITLRQD